METIKSKSLYQRSGEIKGTTRIVDDIVENHMTNPAVNARFLPLKDNPEHFATVRQHLIDFFASGSGGPEEYKSKTCYRRKGMNISQSEYMHVIDDIMKALNKNNIDEETQKDVLAIAML